MHPPPVQQTPQTKRPELSKSVAQAQRVAVGASATDAHNTSFGGTFMEVHRFSVTCLMVKWLLVK